MLPWWLWWLFIPIGAASIIGVLAFGVGHGILGVVRHNPDCQCAKCQHKRETAAEANKAWAKVRKIEQARGYNGPRYEQKDPTYRPNFRSGQRPQGRIVSTTELARIPHAMVGTDNGSRWIVRRVQLGTQPRGYVVLLINIENHHQSQVVVPVTEADRPRWWLVSDR